MSLKRPPHFELIVSIALTILTAGLAMWAYQGTAPDRSVASIPLSMFTGVLLLFVVYFAQLPKFQIELADDGFDPKFEQHYFHLKVTNTSWGFLGGGFASECQGSLEIAGKTYTPKWSTRPEPLIATGFEKKGELWFPVGIPQSWLIELGKTQDIAPGQAAFIDVAMKQRGDTNCYIHEVENYFHSDHKHNPLPPNRYLFTITISCRGRPSGSRRFILNNGEGNDPASLSIECAPN